MKRGSLAILAILISATTVGILSLSAYAASKAHNTLFESGLIGVPSSMRGATGAIRGVNAGGAPWTIAESRVRLSANGELEVGFTGLLITGTGTALDGTTGPVTGVRASLTCQQTNVTATTGVVPLNASGDAQIEEAIILPSSCIGPIILVRVGSTTSNPGPLMGPWIAATGF